MTVEIDPITFFKQFIQLYKENPCLWDTDCKDYNSTLKRKVAYGILIEKLWEINTSADLEMAKNKIGALRSTMKKEIVNSKKSELKGQRYVSKWPYYSCFSFITPHIFKPGNEADGAYKGDSTSDTLHDTSDDHEEEPPKESEVLNLTGSSDIDSEEVNLSQSMAKKRKATFAAETANKSARSLADYDDDCAMFAALMKIKMRGLDPLQKTIAIKLMTDVMFLAETKQLQLCTTMMNSGLVQLKNNTQ